MNMKTTERFTNAVTKLYNAFHNGDLVAMDCAKCAVGNMCDNNFEWRFIPEYGFYDRGNVGYNVIVSTGYSVEEIMNIEYLFMYGHKVSEKFPKKHHYHSDLDAEFKGLCAVVEYLCELDGIPNVMDYTCLFETENEKPKYELSF